MDEHGAEEQRDVQRSISLDGELLAGLYVFAAALTSYEVAHAGSLPAGFASGVKEAVQAELLARWGRRRASGEITFPAVVRRREIEAMARAFGEVAAGMQALRLKLEGDSDPALWHLGQATEQAADLARRIGELAAASHPARQ